MLEKILTSIKKHGKKALVAGLTIGALAMPVKAADDWGYLEIKNNLNSNTKKINIIRDDEFIPGTLDGYDPNDGDVGIMPSGFPNISSDIITNKLWEDYRPNDSNIPYNLKLSFEGALEDPNNTLEFSKGQASIDFGSFFGDKPIIFNSDRLPYGSVVDIRRAMKATSDANNVNIPLIPGALGQYGTGNLEIGTRILADLTDNGRVDLRDFAEMAEDWKKSQGQYIGDISGPNGIPDGYVNGHDLSAMQEDYLTDVNDL